MSPETPHHRFLLNVWQEEVQPEQVEWRGKLQHLPSGEAHYFRDWSRLIDRLEALLSEHAAADSADGGAPVGAYPPALDSSGDGDS